MQYDVRTTERVQANQRDINNFVTGQAAAVTA